MCILYCFFPFLESNGGSVEGYCAGEKEALDTVNKWVRLFSFSFLLCTVMTVVLESAKLPFVIKVSN